MREKNTKTHENMHQNTSSNIKIKTEGENTKTHKTHEKIENKQTEGENTKTHKTHEKIVK